MPSGLQRVQYTWTWVFQLHLQSSNSRQDKKECLLLQPPQERTWSPASNNSSLSRSRCLPTKGLPSVPEYSQWRLGAPKATDFCQLCFCGALYSKHLLLSSSSPDGLTPGGSNLFGLHGGTQQLPPGTQHPPSPPPPPFQFGGLGGLQLPILAVLYAPGGALNNGVTAGCGGIAGGPPHSSSSQASAASASSVFRHNQKNTIKVTIATCHGISLPLQEAMSL
ncbi:hypothetical protein NMY22_g19100 [Coprinellus aureogranulatus]|nr:hypothetical protein NMY22_g19100 [Coprinellus aureogranulatus]